MKTEKKKALALGIASAALVFAIALAVSHAGAKADAAEGQASVTAVVTEGGEGQEEWEEAGTALQDAVIYSGYYDCAVKQGSDFVFKNDENNIYFTMSVLVLDRDDEDFCYQTKSLAAGEEETWQVDLEPGEHRLFIIQNPELDGLIFGGVSDEITLTVLE